MSNCIYSGTSQDGIQLFHSHVLYISIERIIHSQSSLRKPSEVIVSSQYHQMPCKKDTEDSVRSIHILFEGFPYLFPGYRDLPFTMP